MYGGSCRYKIHTPNGDIYTLFFHYCEIQNGLRAVGLYKNDSYDYFAAYLANDQYSMYVKIIEKYIESDEE